MRKQMKRYLAAALGAAVVAVGLVAPAAAVGTTPSVISLVAPAAATYGTTIRLAGTLAKSSSTSTRIAGARVQLQRASHGKANWATVKTALTSKTGAYAFSVVQQAGYDYRAYFAGSTVYKRALSAVKYPVVNRSVLLDKLATSNADTGQLQATGRVVPALPDGTAVYFEQVNGRTWTTFATGTTVAGKVTVTGTRPGSTATYRLRVAARSGFGAGVSANKAFNHYVWRGGFVTPVNLASGSLTVDTTDPSRSSAFITGRGDQVALFSQSTKGCTAYSIMFQRTVGFNGSENVTVWNKDRTKQLANATLNSQHSIVDFDGSMPAGDLWWQQFSPFNAGSVGVEAQTRVLCAN